MRSLHCIAYNISSNISWFLDRVCLYNMNIPENLKDIASSSYRNQARHQK